MVTRLKIEMTVTYVFILRGLPEVLEKRSGSGESGWQKFGSCQPAGKLDVHMDMFDIEIDS